MDRCGGWAERQLRDGAGGRGRGFRGLGGVRGACARGVGEGGDGAETGRGSTKWGWTSAGQIEALQYYV